MYLNVLDTILSRKILNSFSPLNFIVKLKCVLYADLCTVLYNNETINLSILWLF